MRFIIFFCLLIISKSAFAQSTSDNKIDKLLTAINNNFDGTSKNLKINDYNQATYSINSIVINLENLEKFFVPLIDSLKKIKNDAKQILDKLNDKANNPNNNEENTNNLSEKNLKKTKSAQKQAPQEKVNQYLKKAQKAQEEKLEKIENKNWEQAVKLEEKNIEYLEKAIKELEKNSQGSGQGDKKGQESKSDTNFLTAEDANKKLQQVQLEQEKLKKIRRTGFPKPKKQKIPVTRDW